MSLTSGAPPFPIKTIGIGLVDLIPVAEMLRKERKNCHSRVINNHSSLKKKISQTGDFLHLGHKLLKD
jgi:hypothetical protein